MRVKAPTPPVGRSCIAGDPLPVIVGRWLPRALVRISRCCSVSVSCDAAALGTASLGWNWHGLLRQGCVVRARGGVDVKDGALDWGVGGAQTNACMLGSEDDGGYVGGRPVLHVITGGGGGSCRGCWCRCCSSTAGGVVCDE
jgi:hypothetical protein